MKKLAILVVFLTAGVGSYGQGTVQFANLGAGINAQVHIDDLGGALAGTSYLAQLVLVNGTSLTPVGNVASFVGNGYFNGGVVTVPGVAPGANGTFQVFAWDGASGSATYVAGLAAWNAGSLHGGWSNPQGGVTIATGGVGQPPSTPAGLTGLQPWAVTIVPEPSTIALGMIGGLALLLRRRK
jgi:hypothetical protein